MMFSTSEWRTSDAPQAVASLNVRNRKPPLGVSVALPTLQGIATGTDITTGGFIYHKRAMDNELTLSNTNIQPTETGLIINGSLSYDEWEAYGEKLRTVEGAIQWYIGDWLNYGEHKWGEMYAQAVDETQANTWRIYKYVADNVKLFTRINNLSWSHHRLIAPFEPEEQNTWLKDAVNNGWSAAELQREIKEDQQRKRLLEKEINNKNIPGIEIIQGDCNEILPGIANETIDLIVVDPPYNVDKADWDNYGSGNEYALWAAGWLLECKRMLKPSGSIYIFGVNRMLSHLQGVLDGMGMVYRNWIIWDTIAGAGGGLWVNRYEAILYYSKTDATYEDNLSIRLERHEENIREYKGIEWKFKNPSNIWRIPRIDDSMDDRTPHPTQKPVELIERIVIANSPKHGLVLDPFMGSGTTGVACKRNARKFIGIELSAEYVEYARARLSD